MKEIPKAKIIFAFLAIYIIWGSTYLGIKIAIETIPPFFMMGLRSITAGIILYIWSRARGAENITKAQIPPLILIGAAFFLFGHGGLAWGELRVPSGLAALLVASMPFWIASFEMIGQRGTKPGIRGIIGLIAGFGGIALLVMPGDFLGAEKIDMVGAGVILFGTVCWSGGSVYARNANLPDSARLAAGVQLLAGGVMLFIVSFISGEYGGMDPGAISLRSILALVYLVLLGSVTAFSSYVWLLKVTDATRVSTYAFVNPVLAIFIGWSLADENLSVLTLISTAIIVISVTLVLTDRSRSVKV